MKIKTLSREIEVKTILGETTKSGNRYYPTLKMVMPEGISKDDISALLEGSFTIIDNEGIEYKHEGYNTLKEVSISIMQVTSAEQEIEELEAKLAEAQAEYDTTKTELDAAKAEYDNAKTELDAAKAEYDIVKNELESAKTELDTVRAEVEEMQETLDILVEGEV